MKKLLFVLAAAAGMFLAAQTASAQLYFGGSLGFTTSNQKTPNGDGTFTNTSGASFKISPEIGYMFSKRMGVGGVITIQQGIPILGTTDPNDYKGFIGGQVSQQMDLNGAAATAAAGGTGGFRLSGFRIAPYFRYVIVESRRFNLFVDGAFAYGSLTRKVERTPGAWVDAGKQNVIEIGARPGFIVKFDQHFSIIGRLGSLGFTSISNPDVQGGTTRFGLDVDSNNLSLGFLYYL
jgi:hypothetical protein